MLDTKYEEQFKSSKKFSKLYILLYSYLASLSSDPLNMPNLSTISPISYSEESLYIHAFNLLSAFGPKRLSLVGQKFSSFQEAFFANGASLLSCGLDTKTVNAFLKHKHGLNLGSEAKQLNSFNIRLVTYKDAEYPKLLKEIPDSPPLLYVQGMLQPDELAVAAVGSRKCTEYGKSAVSSILQPLVGNGMTLVSGLAYGIDAAVHELCVKAKARTIAVVAGGLDPGTLYPRAHLNLAREIIKHGGAIISEHPPGTAALKQNFVARNRIISGLAAGTVIIECGVKSGALITARYALDQNRTVYAVPGSIYSGSCEGPNNLIKMGAHAVTGAEDIMEDLNLPESRYQKNKVSADSFSLNEKTLINILALHATTTVDELVRQSNMEAGTVIATLTYLEIRGAVRSLGAGQYMLIKKLL